MALQWQVSPVPMLPSGLYWLAQKCRKIGGYVCKKSQEIYDDLPFHNVTITGTEGRLMSPGNRQQHFQRKLDIKQETQESNKSY